MISFPRRKAQTEERAAALVGAHAPAAVIAVEVGGETGDGRLLTYRGDDAAPAAPKFDMLFKAAGDALTIGIGDGGNELAFGAIPKAAALALCGDEKETGRAPVTEVQHVLPAAVSNWGSYALLAALAVACGEPQLVHPPERERKLLARARHLGFIDGVSGFVSETVDGLSHETQLAIVTLLEPAVARCGRPPSHTHSPPPS